MQDIVIHQFFLPNFHLTSIKHPTLLPDLMMVTQTHRRCNDHLVSSHAQREYEQRDEEQSGEYTQADEEDALVDRGELPELVRDVHCVIGKVRYSTPYCVRRQNTIQGKVSLYLLFF